MGDYKDAKLLLETLPSEGKIIDIRGDERWSHQEEKK
jgi:hypothetical protein